MTDFYKLNEQKLRENFQKQLDEMGGLGSVGDPQSRETMFSSFVVQEEAAAKQGAGNYQLPGKWLTGDYDRWGEPINKAPGPIERIVNDGLGIPIDNFSRRSELYTGMDADPDIKAKTDFYGAASDVTNDLGWGAGLTGIVALPSTVGLDDYSQYGKEYNKKLEDLSAKLEVMNRGNAEIIKSGGTINGVTGAKDRDAYNAAMVRLEQGPRGVQGFIDQMDPVERERFIRLNNEQMHSEFLNNVAGAADWFGVDISYLDEFHKVFKKETGETFDFENQAHREALGRFMAEKNK
jgi:hypothetical protein